MNPLPARDPRRVVAYIRTSSAEQGRAFGPESQRRAIKAYADREGLQIVAEHTEDISGTLPLDDRPELEAALASVYAQAPADCSSPSAPASRVTSSPRTTPSARSQPPERGCCTPMALTVATMPRFCWMVSDTRSLHTSAVASSLVYAPVARSRRPIIQPRARSVGSCPMATGEARGHGRDRPRAGGRGPSRLRVGP
jgi:hypothetical protein